MPSGVVFHSWPSSRSLLVFVLAGIGFLKFGALPPERPVQMPLDSAHAVVIPAIPQVLIYGADRFLAANVEYIRAAASGQDLEGDAGDYRIRAHRVIADLNPCHEDNYWIGNATLSFAGASKLGSILLERATKCRYWDEIPPLLLGFNRRFFESDVQGARAAFEVASSRATANAAGFREMAIMTEVSAVKDAEAALAMLETERAGTRDPKLAELLQRRITRLEGLVTLRKAQRHYEARFGRALQGPEQLIESRVLDSFPDDPIRLGYEFRDGEFHLRHIPVGGLASQ